jgi:hypothetical protein
MESHLQRAAVLSGNFGARGTGLNVDGKANASLCRRDCEPCYIIRKTAP